MVSFLITRLIQFVLSKYSQDWGHPLGCGWPTKVDSPSLRSYQLPIACHVGVGVCVTPPSTLECWWALSSAAPCADKNRCCEVLKQEFCQVLKTLFCSAPPSPLTHYPSAPSPITAPRALWVERHSCPNLWLSNPLIIWKLISEEFLH